MPDSEHRRRRQRALKLILWIGVPLLAFVLVSELINLVLRTRNSNQTTALRAVEKVVEQAPNLIPEESTTLSPSSSTTPSPSQTPTSTPTLPPEPISGVEATVVSPTSLRIAWDEALSIDPDGAIVDISGPGLITVLAGYATIANLEPDTSYEFNLIRRSAAGDSLPVTVVISTPPIPASEATDATPDLSDRSVEGNGTSSGFGVGLRYRTCGSAAAAGVPLPIRAWEQPGIYNANPQLDRDGDGVSCET